VSTTTRRRVDVAGADVTIRRLSHGQRSLNDLARNFFGHGENTGAQVVTYTRGDIVAALDAVQPYDWAAFLHRHLDEIGAAPARSVHRRRLQARLHRQDLRYREGGE